MIVLNKFCQCGPEPACEGYLCGNSEENLRLTGRIDRQRTTPVDGNVSLQTMTTADTVSHCYTTAANARVTTWTIWRERGEHGRVQPHDAPSVLYNHGSTKN